MFAYFHQPLLAESKTFSTSINVTNYWNKVKTSGLFFKTFTIVIYDHNLRRTDIGQYYKTILIYDPI